MICVLVNFFAFRASGYFEYISIMRVVTMLSVTLGIYSWMMCIPVVLCNYCCDVTP